ncbi:MAG: OmpA family protein [Flavobacteriaceae bacterium]
MKSIKLLSVLLLIAVGLSAQTSDNPWLISAGINGVSLQNDFEQALNNKESYTKDGIKGLNVGVPSLSVFRSIVGGLAVGGQFSLNNLKEESGPDEIKFFNVDALLKYGFNRDGSVSPYLKGGWGFTSFDALPNSDGVDPSLKLTNTYFGGAGLIFRLSDRFSAFIETSYRATQDRPTVNYLQHTAGLSLGLGGGDADKDGISDKRDKCPDIPGLKEFEGCPDTDGDGLPDNEDSCPEEAGPAANNGCPDTDGDGVLDKDDVCPNEAGLAALNGCPDQDGDGVADADDGCVTVAGSIDNNGCPWPDTDGDGILDKDDDCPNEAGASASGCPVVESTIIDALNAAGIHILFPADGFNLTGDKVIGAVAKVKAILDENPQGIVLVQGHASEDGSEAYNQALSRKRAEAVKAKLIEMGIDASRLEVQAFGESMPIDDEDVRTARLKSRRVVFSAKQ